MSQNKLHRHIFMNHIENLLEKSILTVSLEELIETYPKILKGEISGRVIVDLNK